MDNAREKKIEWLSKNSINAEGITYIYFPEDSYDVKNELKNIGFRFSPELLWHCETIPAGYEEKVIALKVDEVMEFTAWGSGVYKSEVKKIIKDKLVAARPIVKNTSEWLGEPKDKLYDLEVTLVKITGFQSRFGYSQIVKFVDAEGNIIKWFTATQIPYEKNDKLYLSGTIKDVIVDDYEHNAKVTIMTRCKMRDLG